MASVLKEKTALEDDNICRCWGRVGDADLHDLEENIARIKPDVVVIQFHFAFFRLDSLGGLIKQMEKKGIENLYFHINHVLVPPAVDAIMADGQAKINAFIGPAHVSVITGAKIYAPLPDKYHTPVVVSGFEPVDVMQSILMIVKQKSEERAEMEIQYSRSVTFEGNTKAQEMIENGAKNVELVLEGLCEHGFFSVALNPYSRKKSRTILPNECTDWPPEDIDKVIQT